jgi:exodeoxyribonuclease VII small subunit
LGKGKKEGTFEKQLRRLEEIVDLMERGEASLDETMQLYEEGIEISKACLERLSKAELKLKQLSKNVNGSFELFDEKPDK